MLLNPENALFIRGATPVLLLADAPIHDALPPVASARVSGPRPAGWSIVPRLTLCVVDGPGDQGVLIPAMAAPVLPALPSEGGEAEAGDMADWCEDAESAGAVLVLSLPQLPAELDLSHLMAAGSARGGLLPLLG
ncbi:MAG: hypothetical protein HOY76_36590 [Streptomyces sp.]|nr:hypothetical protein [Streptomyces sp.]